MPVGRSVVPAYTTPLWVTPGAALFLGERLTARRTTGVLIGLGGLATPVFSVIVSTLWLREPLSASLVAAVVLILGGIAIGATDAPVPATSRPAPAARSGLADGR